MTLLTVRTKTGDAVHVADPARPGRTLCGRNVGRIDHGAATITAAGIQHPWRCEPCSKKAAALTESSTEGA